MPWENKRRKQRKMLESQFRAKLLVVKAQQKVTDFT